MGVDAKEIRAVIWKILRFSMNTTLRFIENHPIFLGVSVFLLTLYIFFPSVFCFLICSSPILACVAVFILNKLNLRTRPRNVEERLSSSLESKNSGGDRNVARSHLRHQRSVRRNGRRKVEEWDSQASEEEKDKVILTSLYNDLLGRTPYFEESPKAVDTDIDMSEASPDGKSPQKHGNSRMSYHDLADLGGGDLGSGEYKTEGEEVDRKESMSDQKNRAMESVISETERNRRLESLIARRRARRLFRLALDQKNMVSGGEKTSPVQNIPHISISRNNGGFFKVNQDNPSGEARGLQMPGSAPSKLLPTRNPFDLPYDPQEERPNLKGDSFDKEFSIIVPKDTFFGRHESFCRPCLFSPKPLQDSNRLDSSSDVERTITRTHLGTSNDDERKAKEEVSREVESITTENNAEENKEGSDESGKNGTQEAKVEDKLETDSNKEEDDSGLSSSEESEQEFNSLNRAELQEAIRHTIGKLPGPLGNQARNSLPNPLPRGIPPRIDDHHMFYATGCTNSHARTFSIASDLQVEVSDIGSPPTTVDGHDDLSNDGESYIYDTDIDKELAHLGEQSQKRCSRQLDSKPRIETRAEEDNGSVEKPVIPALQFMQVVEQPKEIDGEALVGRDDNSEEQYVKQVVGDLLDQKPFISLDTFSPTNFKNSQLGEHTNHKSTSLSSIVEKIETVKDLMDEGKHENVKHVVEELVCQRQCLSSPNLSTEKLRGDEADMQNSEQNESEELCESTEKINLEAKVHDNKVMKEKKKQSFSEDTNEERRGRLSNDNGINNGSSSIPADKDMELVQGSKCRGAINGLRVSQIDHDLCNSTTFAQSIELLLNKEIKQDGVVYDRMLDNMAENIESKSIEQDEQEAMEEKAPKFAGKANDNTEALAEQKNNVLNAHHHTESLKECRNMEQPGEKVVSQVNEELKDPTSLTRTADPLVVEEKPEDSSQQLNDVNEQEILNKGIDDTKLVQLCGSKNKVEDSIVSEDIWNSNDLISVMKSVETPIQQVSPSAPLSSSSSPMELERINDSETGPSDKKPPPQHLNPDAIESILKSNQFSIVQPMYEKDFEEPEVLSNIHEKSPKKEMAETGYRIGEPEEITIHSDVQETQENKEVVTYCSRGLSSETSNLGNCNSDLITHGIRDDDQTVVEEHNTKEPKPRDDIPSDIFNATTGYHHELIKNETMNASREVNKVNREKNLISTDRCGEATDNVLVPEKEELRKKSDPLYNSSFVNAREESDEPRKHIEAKNIGETTKEADADDETKTTEDEHKVLDMS